MRNLVKVFFLLCLASVCSAADHRLEGVWVVDENSTLEFNLKQKSYSNVSVALMKCMAKSSSLIFTADHMEYIMVSHPCEDNGKSSNIEGYKAKSAYRVLATSPEASAIATKADGGMESFDVIYYENDNKIWIYSPGEPPAYEDHTRLYYIRKQQ